MPRFRIAVEWRKAARSDLASVIEYISDANPIAAKRIKEAIEESVSKPPEHPKIYRTGRVSGTREMIVDGKYIVIYTEGPREIVILRIVHVARDWPPRG